MKRKATSVLIFVISLFVLLFAFGQESKANLPAGGKDTVVRVVHDTVYIDRSHDWMKVFGYRHGDADRDSIWGKPVSYYINDTNCSPLATDFYYGDWRPGCNGMTSMMLDLSSSDNKKLRPFYRWCLEMTIRLSDGCLGEHTGIPARRYAEKFPKEFFAYIDADRSGEMYDQWTGAIAYSGYYNGENYKVDLSEKMANTMLAHCKDCDDKLKMRIDKFAKDCFQNPALMGK